MLEDSLHREALARIGASDGENLAEAALSQQVVDLEARCAAVHQQLVHELLRATRCGRALRAMQPRESDGGLADKHTAVSPDQRVGVCLKKHLREL